MTKALLNLAIVEYITLPIVNEFEASGTGEVIGSGGGRST